MHAHDVLSGWETFILMAPFAGLLVLSMFRLDSDVARRRHNARRRRAFCEMQASASLLRDPDGHIWTVEIPGPATECEKPVLL